MNTALYIHHSASNNFSGFQQGRNFTTSLRVTGRMPEHRGLLTAREREILRGEVDVSRNYLYQIRSCLRAKIEALATDVEILRTYQPDLFEALLETLEL